MVKSKKFQRDAFFKYFNDRFEGLTFDDVLVKPRHSSIVPRDVPLDTWLTNEIPMHIPLVSADMDTVTEDRLAIKMAMEGGMGFLWKHPDIDTQVKWAYTTKYAFNRLIDSPVTIQVDKTKQDVLQTLAGYGNRFSSLVVLDNNSNVVGLVTKDETRFANLQDKVRNFMVPNPIMTTDNLSVEDAYKFMRKHKTGKLVVVNKDRTLKGLYTYKDVAEIVEGITPMYNRDKQGRLIVGANVGVFDKKDKKSLADFLERAVGLLNAKCDVLLVGTAHGDSDNVINSVRELRKLKRQYEFGIVAGNVATDEGAYNLIKAGADCIKVGIGAGAICTTRIVAGIGVPQLSAVYDCAKVARRYGVRVIADGGIRNSNDIVKALAVDADSIMAGGLFAATEESAGTIVVGKDGARYKSYRGMGSVGAMTENRSADRYMQKGAEKLVPEGIEGKVPLKGSVSEVIYQLLGGIRAGLGYVGARSLEELRERAMFLKITPAGQKESHPHDVQMTKDSPNYKPE